MARDWQTAALRPVERAMLAYATKLTLNPGGMRETDLEPLRAAGFDDAEILDIVQVVALFSYYNRLADGLGVPVTDLDNDAPPSWRR